MSMQRCCPETIVAREPRDDDAALFRAIADSARLTILTTLAASEHAVCVCDFTSGLGLNQSTVSHHLKALKDARLVTSERRGTWGYYTLADDARERLDRALGAIFTGKALA